MTDLIIQRPGTIDVTKNNPRDILYIKGNEITDGSIRIMFTDGDASSHIELRQSGVWNDTGFRFASSSVSLGRDLQLSAVGGFLETVNLSEIVDHIKSLVPHIEFNQTGTMGAAHMPITDTRTTFNVFAGPPFSEIISTAIGQSFSVTPTRILHSATHTVGTVGATAEVEVSYYKGVDNTGILLNRMMLPASDMVAGQPFTIVYDSDFGFENVVTIFFEFVSVNNISLETNFAGDVITSQDGHILDELDVMLDEFVIANDLSFVFDNNLNITVHNRF